MVSATQKGDRKREGTAYICIYICMPYKVFACRMFHVDDGGHFDFPSCVVLFGFNFLYVTGLFMNRSKP